MSMVRLAALFLLGCLCALATAQTPAAIVVPGLAEGIKLPPTTGGTMRITLRSGRTMQFPYQSYSLKSDGYVITRISVDLLQTTDYGQAAEAINKVVDALVLPEEADDTKEVRRWKTLKDVGGNGAVLYVHPKIGPDYEVSLAIYTFSDRQRSWKPEIEITATPDALKALAQEVCRPFGAMQTIAVPAEHVVYMSSFSPDGRMLAVNSANTVALYDVANESPKLMATLACGSAVWKCALSADGRQVAAWAERELQIWDVATARRIRVCSTGRPSFVGGLSSDLSRFAEQTESACRVLDTTTGQAVTQIAVAAEQLALSPDGKTLATVQSSGRLALWDIPSGRMRAEGTLGELPKLLPPCLMAFSADGEQLLVGGNGLQVINSRTAKTIKRFDVPARAVAFRNSTTALVGTDCDYLQELRVMDLATGKVLSRLGPLDSYISQVACSADGKRMAAGLDTMHGHPPYVLWDGITPPPAPRPATRAATPTPIPSPSPAPAVATPASNPVAAPATQPKAPRKPQPTGAFTALMRAARLGDAEKARQLIQGSENLNEHSRDGKGFTPLHFAAQLEADKGLDTAKALVDAGAEVDCRSTATQTTALMLAAESNSPQLVEYLIAKGADVNAVDRRGRTPFDFAEHFKYAEVIAVLKQAGGKPGSGRFPDPKP